MARTLNKEKHLKLFRLLNPRPPEGGGSDLTPFSFLNNVLSLTGINAKFGKPFRTSMSRPYTVLSKIFLKTF